MSGCSTTNVRIRGCEPCSSSFSHSFSKPSPLSLPWSDGESSRSQRFEWRSESSDELSLDDLGAESSMSDIMNDVDVRIAWLLSASGRAGDSADSIISDLAKARSKWSDLQKQVIYTPADVQYNFSRKVTSYYVPLLPPEIITFREPYNYNSGKTHNGQ